MLAIGPEPDDPKYLKAGKACAKNPIAAIVLWTTLTTPQERAAFVRGLAEGMGINGKLQ